MKLLLATRNRDKLKEIYSVLEGLDFELVSADDIDSLPEVVEDGLTLEENAVKKALFCARFSGFLTVADDTGLFVEALNGNPGIFAARYAGENCSYSDNRKKLLTELTGEKDRRAEFRTVVALVSPEQVICVANGVVKGFIAHQEEGTNGFGYDPVFLVENSGKTFAEMTDDEKNRISHRSRAFQNLRSCLVKTLKK